MFKALFRRCKQHLSIHGDDHASFRIFLCRSRTLFHLKRLSYLACSKLWVFQVEFHCNPQLSQPSVFSQLIWPRLWRYFSSHKWILLYVRWSDIGRVQKIVEMLFPAAKKVLIPEQDTILVFDRSSNIKCFSAESLPEHVAGLSEIEIRRLRTFIPTSAPILLEWLCQEQRESILTAFAPMSDVSASAYTLGNSLFCGLWVWRRGTDC